MHPRESFSFAMITYMSLQDSPTDDAINIAPHLHKIIYEDEKIRVLKVSVRPGDTADMHWHPHNINYVLAPGKLHFDKPDGTSVDVELTEGQVTFAKSDSYHAVKNIGESTVETIQVELKY